MSTGQVERMARILDGAPIAEAIKAEVRSELAEGSQARIGSLPGVRIFLVGDDSPSRVYASRILRNAASVGVPGELVELSTSTTARELQRHLDAASADPEVGGIIVQMPLPAGIPARAVAEALDPAKDIDGIHPYNAGLLAQGLDGHRPSCAEAAVEDPHPVRLRHRWSARRSDRSKQCGRQARGAAALAP